MAAAEQGPVAEGLVSRVKNILLKPNDEWNRIEAEPATLNGLFLGYACILAAIGPLAALIGGQVFGYSALFVSFKPSLMASVSSAIVSYILSLVAVFVMGVVIDALAPNFGGTKNRIQAFKAAIYSMTAGWIAGIFSLVPALAVLSIVGLYGLYLLYLGLPKLMKAPQDKALAYTAVTVVVYIVIFVVVAAISGAVTAATMGVVGRVPT
jgi:hypothetical protein